MCRAPRHSQKVHISAENKEKRALISPKRGEITHEQQETAVIHDGSTADVGEVIETMKKNTEKGASYLITKIHTNDLSYE